MSPTEEDLIIREHCQDIDENEVITSPRQSITHDSPVQERSAQESPLSVAQITMIIIPTPVPEQEMKKQLLVKKLMYKTWVPEGL